MSSNLVVQDEIYRYRRDPGEKNSVLLKIKHHNNDIFNTLTNTGDLQARLTELGNHMKESWSLHKRLSPLVGGGKLAELEKLVNPYVYGLRGPGAGINSLFLIIKPEFSKRLIIYKYLKCQRNTDRPGVSIKFFSS